MEIVQLVGGSLMWFNCYCMIESLQVSIPFALDNQTADFYADSCFYRYN